MSIWVISGGFSSGCTTSAGNTLAYATDSSRRRIRGVYANSSMCSCARERMGVALLIQFGFAYTLVLNAGLSPLKFTSSRNKCTIVADVPIYLACIFPPRKYELSPLAMFLVGRFNIRVERRLSRSFRAVSFNNHVLRDVQDKDCASAEKVLFQTMETKLSSLLSFMLQNYNILIIFDNYMFNTYKEMHRSVSPPILMSF